MFVFVVFSICRWSNFPFHCVHVVQGHLSFRLRRWWIFRVSSLRLFQSSTSVAALFSRRQIKYLEAIWLFNCCPISMFFQFQTRFSIGLIDLWRCWFGRYSQTNENGGCRCVLNKQIRFEMTQLSTFPYAYSGTKETDILCSKQRERCRGSSVRKRQNCANTRQKWAESGRNFSWSVELGRIEQNFGFDEQNQSRRQYSDVFHFNFWFFIFKDRADWQYRAICLDKIYCATWSPVMHRRHFPREKKQLK